MALRRALEWIRMSKARLVLDMKYQTLNHMRLRWRPLNKASRRELVPCFTECKICCSSYQAHYIFKCCRAHVWVCGGQLFGREDTNSKPDDDLVLWWNLWSLLYCWMGMESWHAIKTLSHLPFLILKIRHPVSFMVLLEVVTVTNSNAVPYSPSKVPTCSWYVGSRGRAIIQCCSNAHLGLQVYYGLRHN